MYLPGVPIRQLQLLEQRQRDINKARAITNRFCLGKGSGVHGGSVDGEVKGK